MTDRNPTPGPSNPKKRRRLPSQISFLSSPMKKRHKRVDMVSTEKMIAINVYKYIEKSKTSYPLKTEIIKTTANIMGVSESTVQRIINEYKSTGKVISLRRTKPKYAVISNLDDFTLSAIRKKVHKFYFENDMPTINKVLKAVNDDEDLPSFTRSTMYKIKKKLNFNYMKRSRKSILLDRGDLILWRRNYLLKIKDYRKEGRKIYYTDETWVNEGHTSNYVWVNDNIKNNRQAYLNGLSTGLKNPQKGKRLIVSHIGSTDGFLEGGEWLFKAQKTDREGDYHSEMDAYNFEKWFKTILELVEQGSVIVLDNAPYHSRLAEKVPNMSWRKEDIQAWLQEKQINFEENEIKAELLTKFNKADYNKKVVDIMAAEKNILTLRLPPYHCELNPIELIWAQLKSHVGRNNKSFKMAEVIELTKEGISKIGAESWVKCIEHVIKQEDKMMQLDGLIDTITDNMPTPSFVINVGGTDSNETSNSDE